MATGGETNFSCCSSCLDDGRNTVARHYCVDCEMYFCTKCVKYHNKIPSTRKHQVNEVNVSDVANAGDDTTSLQSDVLGESGRRLRCTLHQGKLIDTFCKDHNKVCCGSCAVVKHRSCTTLSIAIAAKDFKSSPEIKESKDALTENLFQCKQEKAKRSENLESIGQQKLEQIENVDKYEEKIIARIKELANISRNEIRSKYEEYKSALDTDMQALDVVIVTNTEYVDKLEQTDEEQLFTYAKTSKTATKDGQILLEAITKDWKERNIRFYFNPVLENSLLGLQSFGWLEDNVSEYKATLQTSMDIKQAHNKDTYIFDIAIMGATDVLVTDYQNQKLKRYHSNLQFKDEVLFSGLPVAVCKIDEHEVAVRFRYSGDVQIVSVGDSMQLTSSFTIDNDGWGMMYDAEMGEIFACEDNKVTIYDKTGHKHRTLDKDTNGEQLFSTCREIVLGPNSQDIYVTDSRKGVLVLDKRSGTLKLNVTLPDVRSAWPLCVLPGDICLTGCQMSGLIVQVDKSGKQIGNLIDSKSGRIETFSVVYDSKQSRLFIGGRPNMIHVYTLSTK